MNRQTIIEVLRPMICESRGVSRPEIGAIGERAMLPDFRPIVRLHLYLRGNCIATYHPASARSPLWIGFEGRSSSPDGRKVLNVLGEMLPEWAHDPQTVGLFQRNAPERKPEDFLIPFSLRRRNRLNYLVRPTTEMEACPLPRTLVPLTDWAKDD